ncbi:hypothetical protein ACOMHN_025958 [Nucella lapillus]
MPCWFFDRKEIRNSPSYQDSIDQATENRYRREGARLILDAGTKLGLRYDTCATGVVYFHRFFMFHSFREFHRYTMAACCLFLAGKVEETPKKCKDIIRTVQTLLSPEAFATFGEDPREEVMTMERILLQTIKFDLQVEHSYSWLLSYAKQIKGDKDKIQKMAQMSWTFINDSLCTTLSLQWESEIIAVSLMYLASRLTKFDPTDWTGRVPGSKSRWWEDLIEGMSMELMEDICHQVLACTVTVTCYVSDICHPVVVVVFQTHLSPGVGPVLCAAAGSEAGGGAGGVPPCGPGSPWAPHRRPQGHTPTPTQRPTPATQTQTGEPSRLPCGEQSKEGEEGEGRGPPKQPLPAVESAPSSRAASPNLKVGPGAGAGTGSRVSAVPVNPYVSSSMYSSSFMSQEGQQSIQSLLGGTPASSKHPPQQYPAYPPPANPGQYPPPAARPYNAGGYAGSGAGYAAAPGQFPTQPPYTGSYTAAHYGQAPPSYTSSTPQASTTTPSSYQPPSTPYTAPPTVPTTAPAYPPYSNPTYPPPMNQPPPAGPPPPFPPPGFGGPPPSTYTTPPPPMMAHRGHGGRPNQSNLAPVRHVSDRGGMR